MKKKKKPNSSTIFDIYCSGRVCLHGVLVEISQKSKLKQLTMVRNSEYLIHRGTSIKEPEFNTIASPC